MNKSHGEYKHFSAVSFEKTEDTESLLISSYCVFNA